MIWEVDEVSGAGVSHVEVDLRGAGSPKQLHASAAYDANPVAALVCVVIRPTEKMSLYGSEVPFP